MNLDEDLDEADPKCRPASGLYKVLENNTADTGIAYHPHAQPVLSSTEPTDCRRNTETVAGLEPGITTEIAPSRAEHTCTLPVDITRPAGSDLTTDIQCCCFGGAG